MIKAQMISFTNKSSTVNILLCASNITFSGDDDGEGIVNQQIYVHQAEILNNRFEL
jgi:hypothetical protein